MEYHNYSFKIDGCLNVVYRSTSEKEAKRKAGEDWPRSTIELKGVDLPSAERGIAKPVPTMGVTPKRKSKSVAPATKPASKTKEMEDKLGLNETEASLVSNFL